MCLSYDYQIYLQSGRPVSDAKNVTDSIPSGVELPTDMSATEMQYFTSLETALATSGFEINALAVAYKVSIITNTK